MGEKIRLDRYLADMGKGSRSQIRQAAKKGRIQVNGRTEMQTDRKVDPMADQVCMDGRPVSYQTLEYFMLYKPKNVVSATEDSRYRTVIDLLEGENRRDLFPVGRLDRDTEGLLLLTNDGELAHQLLSPKKHVDKTYHVTVAHVLGPEDIRQLEQGVDIGEERMTLPAKAEILSDNVLLLTIQEGKYHQVKRMLQAVDNQVTALKRIRFGGISLDEGLAPGAYRPLTPQEESCLKEGCQ